VVGVYLSVVDLIRFGDPLSTPFLFLGLVDVVVKIVPTQLRPNKVMYNHEILDNVHELIGAGFV
jgi:hypothetical protein